MTYPPPHLNVEGAYCPRCGNRKSEKVTQNKGCIFLLALFTFGLALLAWPFLPRYWVCQVCQHQWRA